MMRRTARSALTGRDFISTADWTREEVGVALDVAEELKAAYKAGRPHRLLPDKTLFMIFLDLSTRTRNAFEAGMTQLGGHAHYIDANTSQIAHGESPRDMGIILSSYGHGIAIRHDKIPGQGNAYMREVANHATVPVINLQCDEDHPTQQLADLMTIEEVFGTRDLSGMRICVSWAYSPSYAKPMSVPQGLALLLPRFGADLVIARPPEYRLMPHVMERARRLAAEGGGRITEIEEMDEAFRGAQVVYPKSWGAEHLFGNEREALALNAKYTSWICDRRRMALAARDAIYMHCLPADRGYEVTDEVIDGPQSVVFQQAENRLHTAKALLALTMGGFARRGEERRRARTRRRTGFAHRR
ncbi:MAG: ornithine carbamoyltransferase [Armatimonadota bacterium]|nr:ornithine carbamoyltransferase [Armatimonadota bacterium]MDR7468404.1 ornithine carbamoyltransferase [Armatimonadota bacterium]MDR7494979.1 ornithine carbamoyltransferase [Armatimonadota bacterium]MDR7505859.1 ornithine carbamoyltransferase [Armatimonadota bacterium]MDR7559557.1 ornithine carbamoyltransferase [Armatimonadota bacterium]